MEYLFWAYTLTWIVLFGYTMVLGMRQKKLIKELAWLKQTVGEKQRD